MIRVNGYLGMNIVTMKSNLTKEWYALHLDTMKIAKRTTRQQALTELLVNCLTRDNYYCPKLWNNVEKDLVHVVVTTKPYNQMKFPDFYKLIEDDICKTKNTQNGTI